MRRAALRDIAIYHPERVVTNADLAAEWPGWDAERFGEKTGILSRHIVADGECASDLCVAAAHALFSRTGSDGSQFDFVIFCSETPDYVTPSTSALLQTRLGIPAKSGVIDINQACSGYVYGLALAAGIIESHVASNVLLFTSTTFSRMLDPEDRAVRPLFGDAATVSWVGAMETEDTLVGPFEFGTDGTGAEHIIARGGAFRHPGEPPVLRMNGPEVAAFTLRTVPMMIRQMLERCGCSIDDVAAIAPHQPNRMLLEQLQRKAGIDPGRMLIDFEDSANTGSSTIPIVLRRALDRGALHPGDRVMLLGFGGGLSWGSAMIRLT